MSRAVLLSIILNGIEGDSTKSPRYFRISIIKGLKIYHSGPAFAAHVAFEGNPSRISPNH
jgi:hypothetical protein